MTSIPEHLRRRAEEARRRAGASAPGWHMVDPTPPPRAFEPPPDPRSPESLVPEHLLARARARRNAAPAVRPDWDTYFLALARAVSARADCRRAQHGAVITQNNRVVSTGYNGSPAGGPSCLAGDCPRGLLSYEELASLSADYSNCVAVHAEANAIAYASHRDTVGATIHITGPSCDTCSKLIQAAGITRVVIPGG